MHREKWLRAVAVLLALHAAVFGYDCYSSLSFLGAAASLGPDEPPFVLTQALEQGSIAAAAGVLAALVARRSVVGLYIALAFAAVESLAAFLFAVIGFVWGLGLLSLALPLPFSAPALLAWPTLVSCAAAIRRVRRRSSTIGGAARSADSPADSGATAL